MTTANKFTPGPWTVGEYQDEPAVFAESSTGDLCLITSLGESAGFDSRTANAHLIAASPELLHQLELAQRMLLQTDWRHEHAFMAEIDAAIAKAKGGA